MSSDFLPRTLSPTLLRAAGQFPAVVVTGPRQSGKTTLVRHHFADSHAYCTLDDPLTRRQARNDPLLLLERFPPPVILDEIQYAPDLLHAVKVDIDRHRDQRGRYVITGSQHFPMMRGVSESLAGRTAVLSLQGFSYREMTGRPDVDVAWRDLLIGDAEVAGSPDADSVSIAEAILRGGFPEPAIDPELDRKLWYGGYLQTYLERDVRNLRAVSNLGDFERFLFALAARSGGLLSYQELARDLGLTAKTVREWVSLLETSGQVFTVRPYHSNLGKRLVKRPKVYFLDTGVLTYLLGLTEPDQVLQGAMAGAVFETAVLGQLYRLLIHRGERPRIYFWRTRGGHEVDFLIEHGGELIPIEAKLTATPTPRHATALDRLHRDVDAPLARDLLVCLVKERFPLSRHADAVPFGSF